MYTGGYAGPGTGAGSVGAMSLWKRALTPATGFLDRRIDWRAKQLQEQVEGDYARATDLNAVSDSLAKVYADLLEATTDVRRWLADDLDAATEATALTGRALTRLSDAVERLADEVAGLSQRVARLEGPDPDA